MNVPTLQLRQNAQLRELLPAANLPTSHAAQLRSVLVVMMALMNSPGGHGVSALQLAAFSSFCHVALIAHDTHWRLIDSEGTTLTR